MAISISTSGSRLTQSLSRINITKLVPNFLIPKGETDTTGCSTAARRVPAEILEMIFRHSVADLAIHLSTVIPFARKSNVKYHREILTPLIHKSSLYAACLVCCAWYSAANKFLYSYPCLVIPRRIRLFARTIAEHPKFIPLITRLYIYNFNPTLYAMWMLKKDRSENALIQILKQCTAVNTLCIDEGTEIYMPLVREKVDIFGEDIGIKHTALRYLNISGRTHRDYTKNFALSLARLDLHSLCLNDVLLSYLLPEARVFPSFPNLHTLKLHSNRYGHKFKLRPEAVPSLRNMEFKYNATLFFDIEDEGILQQLDSLHMEGSTELLSIQSLITRGWPDCTVKRFTLGPILSDTDGAEGHLIEAWHPPESTEDLTMLVSLCECEGRESGQRLAFFDLIVQFFASEATRYHALSTFVLRLDFDRASPGFREEVQPSLDAKLCAIRNLCLLKSVEFLVEYHTLGLGLVKA